jgi:hypothetical protein
MRERPGHTTPAWLSERKIKQQNIAYFELINIADERG